MLSYIGVLLLMLVKMAKTKKWRETIFFPHFKTNKDPEHENINDSGNHRSGQ
jgi:hypothetical protein